VHVFLLLLLFLLVLFVKSLGLLGSILAGLADGYFVAFGRIGIFSVLAKG
jgi:hypothetical protein